MRLAQTRFSERRKHPGIERRLLPRKCIASEPVVDLAFLVRRIDRSQAGGNEAMRYMFLVYSVENGEPNLDLMQSVAQRHRQIMDEAARIGVFESAEPLKPTSTATTVRTDNGKVLLLDGPFAETKEQLAGYYILNCKDLD